MFGRAFEFVLLAVIHNNNNNNNNNNDLLTDPRGGSSLFSVNIISGKVAQRMNLKSVCNLSTNVGGAVIYMYMYSACTYVHVSVNIILAATMRLLILQVQCTVAWHPGNPTCIVPPCNTSVKYTVKVFCAVVQSHVYTVHEPWCTLEY